MKESQMDGRVADCVAYFKQNKGFTRLMTKIKDKYKSIGTVGGSVVLQELKTYEKDALSGLLRKDYMRQRSATIRLDDVQKAIDRSRFAGVSIAALLAFYYGEEILSKKDQRLEYEQERANFFEEIIDQLASNEDNSKEHSCNYGGYGRQWIESVLAGNDNAYRTLMQRYDSDRRALKTDLLNVCKALDSLPFPTRIRLAVFASNITTNPHAFDDNTGAGQLFLYGLMYVFSSKRPETAEEKAELFYKAGIVFDGVSSSVLCYGVIGYFASADGGNIVHPGWEGFLKCRDAVQIPLSVPLSVLLPTKYSFKEPRNSAEQPFKEPSFLNILCSY